ncbi:MAG: nucleotidyltransferase family protein [Clostridiales bacterium]|jgi:predicted nucleotidyltransferase|nr:nucleotidyltransferase family protein [Clostridiales bacterium]
MDKVCGIITEYNPFHNGHAHHLAASRRETGADGIVAVMSGNFVQRGEPAIIDKHSRAQMALRGGVDIVLELPVPWATASAEGFASGACRLLAATNIVDCICFGSEMGEIAPLLDIAHHLCNESNDFKAILKKQLAAGMSFPAARAVAVASTLNDNAAEIITHPNNILGIEYLKAIIRHGLPMTPHTTERYGTPHNSDFFDGDSASAGAIRKHIRHGKELLHLAPLMPRDSFEILTDEYQKSAINALDNFSPHFHYALHITPSRRLAELSGLAVAAQNRLMAAARRHYLISDVLKDAKSKNYTHTALQRAALRIVLGISADAPLQDIPYIRVLGFRRKKEALLRRLHGSAAVPVITNLKHAKSLPKHIRDMLGSDMAAARMYLLGLKPYGIPEKSELETPMVII